MCPTNSLHTVLNPIPMSNEIRVCQTRMVLVNRFFGSSHGNCLLDKSLCRDLFILILILSLTRLVSLLLILSLLRYLPDSQQCPYIGFTSSSSCPYITTQKFSNRVTWQIPWNPAPVRKVSLCSGTFPVDAAESLDALTFLQA